MTMFLALSATALWAMPASAHVEPSPAAIEAGTSATLTFGVEHGCGESPLVKVEIQVPDGVSDVAVSPAPDGWTGAVADGVVTFTGGPQPAHEGIDFAIHATFPDTPDELLGFPTIETCEEGTVEWIQAVVEGADEPEFPAPTVLLTAGAPTEEQLSPPADDEGSGAEGPTTTVGEETSSSDSSSDAGPIIGVILLVIIVGGAGALFMRRRRA